MYGHHWNWLSCVHWYCDCWQIQWQWQWQSRTMIQNIQPMQPRRFFSAKKWNVLGWLSKWQLSKHFTYWRPDWRHIAPQKSWSCRGLQYRPEPYQRRYPASGELYGSWTPLQLMTLNIEYEILNMMTIVQFVFNCRYSPASISQNVFVIFG